MVVLRRQLAFVQPFAGVVAFVCGIVLGMAKACPNCKSSFFLCGSCDRNHWYCSAECSEAARRLSMRRSARKYKTTSSGREVQRAAQAKYRASLRRRARSALDAALSLGAVTPISTTVASSDEGDAGSAGCAEQHPDDFSETYLYEMTSRAPFETEDPDLPGPLDPYQEEARP